MVANERGFATATGFSFVKGYPDDRAVGVFIGKLFIEMCTADVYLEHHVCLERFATDRARRRSSGDGMSQQARLGLHTMRAGGRVTYNHLEDGESYETAWVMAVVYKPKSAREQARKFVILFEPSSSKLFLQGCNSWKRVAKSNTTLDPDEPDVLPQHW